MAARLSDLFLINRDDVTYKIKQEDLMAKIQPTDYMLLNRGDITYKINGQDVIDSFIPELVLNEVILSPTTIITRDTVSVTLDAYGGDPPYTIEYQWVYKNVGAGVSETELDGATDKTLYIPDGFAGYNLACRVTITDSRGTAITKQSAWTSAITLFAEAPVMESVDLTKVGNAPERFTNQTFNAQLTLSKDGEPASTKLLTAYTTGSFTQQLETSPIASFSAEPINYNLLLSTNDPGGVVDGYLIFEDYGDDANISSQYGRVGAQYYIQFDFPDPIKWDWRSLGVPGGTGDLGVQGNPGAITQMKLAFSDNVSGRGAFRDVLTWAPNGYGAFNIVSFQNTTRETTEVYAARWYDIGKNTGTFGFKQINSSQQAFKNIGNYDGDGKLKTKQYINTDKRIILQFAGDTNFDTIQVGDYIFQTNNPNVNGHVYKILDNNAIELTGNSDPNSWTPGQTITLPARPVEDSKFYLVLDGNGNVLDLDKNKPAAAYFKDGVNPVMPLTFPATFPGGLTPDQELNPGTRLTVEAAATNSEGASNIVTDELVPGGTSTFVAPATLPPAPIAVNGYYPLYETEADANAAGSGSSHTHTLNNRTYYMPNGVTMYHGNYSGSSY